MSKKNIVSKIVTDDPTNQSDRAVEVYVTLLDGTERWCFFHSPETIRNCGDLVKDTNIRVHYGAKHMFVVSELSEEIIHKTLAQLDESGEILDCTMGLE